MGTFIVAYTVESKTLLGEEFLEDHYDAFRDEIEGKSPEQQAEERYNELLQQENLYSASVAEVKTSTDY